MTDELSYFSQVDARRPVLAGHKPVKRKIMSPFSAIPSLHQVNTTADIFPELLWISLLFERWGYHRAIRIAAPFRKALAELDDTRPWHLLSEISKITEAEWSALVEDAEAFKTETIEAFAPLLVYPQLSLAFMRDRSIIRERAIEALELCVGRHSNRFETPGAATIGTFVFLEAYTGNLRVPRGMLEGLSAIVDKPGSDEAELAASGARALALAFWSADTDPVSRWPAEFWRTNRTLSACRARST